MGVGLRNDVTMRTMPPQRTQGSAVVVVVVIVAVAVAVVVAVAYEQCRRQQYGARRVGMEMV